jgi:hypothetical protein
MKSSLRGRQAALMVALPIASLLLSSCQPFVIGRTVEQFSEDGSGERARIAEMPTIQMFARDLDTLERHIEQYGSVVAKQPDVWGQARLTKYRDEYEQTMAAQLGNFQFTLQGQVSGSDQAYFADAFALGAAASSSAATIQRPRGNPPSPVTTSSSTIFTPGSLTAPTTLTESQTVPGTAGPGAPSIAIPVPPSATGTFGAFNNLTRTQAYMAPPIGFANARGGLTIEPTLLLDQQSVFINHLHELRRISEGDDTADSPGYALDLVRLPISVLPGKRTDQGYGAEVTMTLRPYLNDELLATTFRNLVLNDLVDQLGFPLTQFVDNSQNDVYFDDRATEAIQDLFGVYDDIQFLQRQRAQPDDSLLQSAIKLIYNVSLQPILAKPEWNWFTRLVNDQIKKAELIAEADKARQALRKALMQIDCKFAAVPLNTIQECDRAICQAESLAKENYVKQFASQPDKLKAAAEKIQEAVKNKGTQTKSSVISKSAGIKLLQSIDINIPIEELSKSLASEDTVTESKINNALKMSAGPAATNQLKGAVALNTELQKSRNALQPLEAQLSDILRRPLPQLSHLKPIALVPTTRSRRARSPFPPSELSDIYGFEGFYRLASGVYQALARERFSRPNPSGIETYIQLPDVQSYLQEEIAGAQNLLQEKEHAFLWDHCNLGLAAAIHGYQLNNVAERRSEFIKALRGIEHSRHLVSHRYNRAYDAYDATDRRSQQSGRVRLVAGDQDAPPAASDASTASVESEPILARPESTTEALAWAIIVDSALLTEQLEQDMKESAGLKGCPPIDIPPEKRDYYRPDPSPEAKDAFKQYVECRWPIHVFALDPAAWQQNLASTFSMRREMQLALSLAFVNGRMSANNMMQFARRIEFDFATVDLNGTAVGFSHGDDTFGWRFYPRFQTPDVDNNLTVFFRDQLWGGPNKNDLLHQRRLEPGIRECYAIVIMPSFVPYATLNVSTNWFNLVNPKKKELTTEYAVRLSNHVKAIENYAPCVVDRECYRDGEWDRMKEKAEQLATRLPLQSTKVQVPYENTLGGFAMFNTGVTDLAPELVGWYGTSAINPNAATTVFLVGNHFSVHSTVVIAGGQPITTQQLLSRQVVQVTIPQNPMLVGDAAEKFVDVQIATPYGVTQHLLIPAVVPPKPDESPLPSTQPTGTAVQSIAWNPATFSIAFSYSGTGIVSPQATSSSTTTTTTTTATASVPVAKPATVLIQEGDVNGTKYDVVDVTLKFDKKYGVNPPTNSIVINNVAFDSKRNGYPIAADTLAAPIVNAFSSYFGPEDTNPPCALSTTTKLTFRSSTGAEKSVEKTTSNSLTIQWIKAPTASGAGGAGAGQKTPGT